jgi:hypothetical protein
MRSHEEVVGSPDYSSRIGASAVMLHFLDIPYFYRIIKSLRVRGANVGSFGRCFCKCNITLRGHSAILRGAKIASNARWMPLFVCVSGELSVYFNNGKGEQVERIVCDLTHTHSICIQFILFYIIHNTRRRLRLAVCQPTAKCFSLFMSGSRFFCSVVEYDVLVSRHGNRYVNGIIIYHWHKKQ